MTFTDISEDIQNFIKKYVQSVGDLDVVLLLATDLTKEWTSEDVSRILRTNVSYASTQLDKLAAGGLLRRQSRDQKQFYTCAFDTETLDRIHRLEELYKVKTSALIRLIYSQPIDVIQKIADAFKIKKD